MQFSVSFCNDINPKETNGKTHSLSLVLKLAITHLNATITYRHFENVCADIVDTMTHNVVHTKPLARR